MNSFDPNMRIGHIVIVGLGGTGSQVARSVARILYDMQQLRMHTPKMALIDPDIIEAKNVGRQLYVEGDIGQPKARVLARRFNMALGLDIAAFETPLNVGDHASQYGTIIVGCVDNHLARREIAKIGRCIWIDAGNHKSEGQVVIGNVKELNVAMRNTNGANGVYQYLPNAALLFPGLLEPEPPKPEPAPEASCADLVAMREQDLLINDWMAVVTSQYVYKLLYRQPIHSFMSFISADAMAVRSVPISRENLEAYLPLEEKTSGPEAPTPTPAQDEDDPDEDFEDDDLDEGEYLDEDDYARHGE